MAQNIFSSPNSSDSGQRKIVLVHESVVLEIVFGQCKLMRNTSALQKLANLCLLFTNFCFRFSYIILRQICIKAYSNFEDFRTQE